jgi:DNA replication protein DnaC
MKITKAEELAESIAERLEACRVAVESKKEIKSTEHGKESQIRPTEIIGRIPKRAKPWIESVKHMAMRQIERIQKNQGLYVITGPNGTGKTVLGASIATYWTGPKVRWTDAWEMLNEIKATFDGKHQWKIPTESLLVVDEFEKYNGSEWAATTLDRTICKRYDECKPTVIITNITTEELNNLCTGSLIRRAVESNGIIDLKKPHWNQ